ncbi:hypothetical protein Pan97_37810 [Bremerella volcania]|uniref:Uncharacterized protein n=1 Tax=Bremerella volcania TaxID=2527984 RepID=A0A518CBX4_9BACT|nr:hypothetical protein [Bremerella volcania]QDU76726.1 hypothetical protein Pan97_37810 [Bremerella volcania]
MTEITEDTPEQDVTDATVETTNGHALDASDLPMYDDMNTPVIALVGFVSAVVTFICIIGLQAAYLQFEKQQYEEKVVNVKLEVEDSIVSAQKAKLNDGYSWVNKETKTIGMPIEQAMKVIADKYESN